MPVVVRFSRLLLASVFAVAGIEKLRDRAGSRRSLADFGIPVALAAPLAFLLPLAELACAIALLRHASAWWGAAGVAVLLSLFILGISLNLAQGRAPSCRCFGQLAEAPVSWKTLVRNASLLALAGLFLWQGPEYPAAWPSFGGINLEATLPVVTIFLAALLLLTLWLLFHMLRQNGRLLLRLEAVERKLGIDPDAPAVEGLPAGDTAPPFRLASLDGRTVTSEALFSGTSPLLLLFVEPGCGACDALLTEVARWQSDYAGRLEIVPVSAGGLEANLAKSAEHKLQNLLLQTGRETSEAYRVNASPSAVVITGGKIAATLAVGADEIRKLVKKFTLPPAAKKGDPLPPFPLTGLKGEIVDLASLRRSLLLFWSPSCGFCQQMLDDVKKWERARPRDAPDLVIISSGTPEENRRQGFRSTVLLDPIFGAGSVLGASGTPSGVLIDEYGRVASDVGVGASAVLELARLSVPSTNGVGKS